MPRKCTPSFILELPLRTSPGNERACAIMLDAACNNRANFPASGPVIVSESPGLPWSTSRFRDRWREIARKAGIPDNVQNRDSRAGAAMEADRGGRTAREGQADARPLQRGHDGRLSA
jgi:hypothetical protein